MAKAAVVTGAGSGIGRATAIELGRAGYAVAVADVDATALEETAELVGAEGGEVIVERLDVSKADGQRAFAERCRSELGGIDVLVNNAGIVRVGRFEQTTEADWRRLFEVNLLGMVLGTQAFLPMLRERRGHIVNVGSGTSVLPFPGYAAYGSLKVAVLWLSEYLRAELRDDGVTVSCVCPLLVKSRIGDAVQASANRQPGFMFDPPEKIARLIVRAIERRTFLPYGGQALRILHLTYRVAPWLVRPVLDQMTRSMNR